MQTSTSSGKRYFVTFIDDKSRYCVVYLIRTKSEVMYKLVNFVAFAEKQTDKRVKSLCCDNSGEYASEKMDNFCSDQKKFSSMRCLTRYSYMELLIV